MIAAHNTADKKLIASRTVETSSAWCLDIARTPNANKIVDGLVLEVFFLRTIERRWSGYALILCGFHE